jgi:hypothetical protein
MISLRIKSIARVFLAASMLATVACESATSPIARAADDNASFAKSSTTQSTLMVVAATNAKVGEAVNVTATLYTSNHPLGGRKMTLTVDGGSPSTVSGSRLGTATWSVKGLAAGTHAIVVSFAGDNGYTGSSASTTATVSP